MTSRFFFKMAISNLRKNSKFNIPYMCAGIGTVMMFYISLFMTLNKGMQDMPGSENIKTIMVLGSTVIGIFACIFLIYTNSFLIKRRKKEFGLYNVLGMEKKHVGRVIVIEHFILSLVIITSGLILGIIFSRFVYMVALKLVDMPVVLNFEISGSALLITFVVFSSIYLLIAIISLIGVRLGSPIELLRGGNEAEREPKTKALAAALGFICIGTGYYIAVSTKDPISALLLFFVAVVLVIIGTYLLFTAGSIWILKRLRNNKTFYYKSNNFTAVSGMIYRMKQNAVGLASICILSTMVLVMISATVSMYVGVEDAIKLQFPNKRCDVMMETSLVTSENQEVVERVDHDRFRKTVEEEAEKLGAKAEVLDMTEQLMLYGTEEDGKIYPKSDYVSMEPKDAVYVSVMPLSSYNDYFDKSETLKIGEAIVGTDMLEGFDKSVNLGDMTFDVKKDSEVKIEGSRAIVTENIKGMLMLVVRDDEFDNVVVMVRKNLIPDEPSEGLIFPTLNVTVDLTNLSTPGAQEQFMANVRNQYYSDMIDGFTWYGISKAAFSASIKNLVGSFLFLGVFLGIVFIMATVMIIYYKQISEGYYDRDKFVMMQKVGMSKAEVKKSIKTQVLMVFFLPLITAGIHMSMGFPMIVRLMRLFGLTNTNLYIICALITFVIFSIIYAQVYMVIAKEYYKIVEK